MKRKASKQDSYGYYGSGYGDYGSYGGYGGGYGGDGYGYGGYGKEGGYGAPTRSLRDYMLIIRERIWWLIAAIFIVMVGVFVYTLNTTPQYRAVARLELNRETGNNIGVVDVTSDTPLHTPDDVGTELEKMTSSTIVRMVGEDLTGEERQAFMEPYENALTFTSGPLTPVQVLGRNRSIAQVKGSLIVNISYAHTNPDIAAKVANYFAEAYIEHDQKVRTDELYDSVADLTASAELHEQKARDLREQLASYKEKHNTVDVDRPTDGVHKDLVDVRTNLRSHQDALTEREARVRDIEAHKAAGKSMLDLSFIASDAAVRPLLDRLTQTEIEIETLKKRYRHKHPRMIEAVTAYQNTEDALNKAIDQAVQQIYADLERNRAKYQQFEADLAKTEQKLIALARLRVPYQDILAELENATFMAEHFRSRRTQMMELIGKTQPRATIIDHATPPGRPYKPDWVMNLALGLFGGCVFGVGLVFVVAFIDDRVKTAYDIETAIGLPIIGLVPRIKKLQDGDKAQAVATGMDKHTLEAFRGIHSTLNLNEDSRKAKCLLTTSTVPSEGKSFVSTNLAITYGNHGEKTLLIDCDLRMPNVAKSLGLDNEKGLIDHFDNNVPIDDLIKPEIYPGVDVLSTGGRSKKPTQIISSKKFENLMHELRMRYDKIIIDSPPLAPVSDALNLLPLVDGVLYVIRFNAVKRKTAKNNIRRLWESSTPVFGAVLNNISVNIAHYYYSHYYDKSYKDYYIREGETREDMADREKAAVKADA